MSYIKQIFIVLALCLISGSFVFSPNIEAMSVEQRNLYRKGIQYYEKVTCETLADDAAAADAGATAEPPAVSSQCQCNVSGGGGGGPIDLTGSDNEEKIFNFFVGQGLKPFQAAGIMGNMYEESGLNPRALQPGTTGDAPIPGRGYGLVQWTFPARQDPLIKKARDAGKKVYDLGIQLGYVIDELNGTHQRAFAELKKSTNSDQATEAIEIHYETHAGVPSGNLHQIRKDKAAEFLTKYGSGTPSSPGATTPEASPSSGSCGTGSDGGGDGGGTVGAYEGTAAEAAQELLDNPGITIFDDKNLIQQAADGQKTPLDPELIKFLAAMAKTHKFGISSLYRGPCSDSNHCVGKAADINPTIDGQTISYTENNAKIQKFIDDAAKLLGTTCENGVPNQAYVTKTKANGSKCEVFLDIGTGPHVHLAVAS
ncbi:MAG: phage tail tip lysozyme [Candidatus Saccharimonadales bacterium]